MRYVYAKTGPSSIYMFPFVFPRQQLVFFHASKKAITAEKEREGDRKRKREGEDLKVSWTITRGTVGRVT